MVEVKYSCPAFPPYDLRVGRVYRFEKDAEGYVVSDAKRKIRMDLEEIKMLFSPVDKTWKEVLETPKSEKKN